MPKYRLDEKTCDHVRMLSAFLSTAQAVLSAACINVHPLDWATGHPDGSMCVLPLHQGCRHQGSGAAKMKKARH